MDSTRQRILDAAADLFVGSGYEHASIWVLAQESEASNGSIYHHFGSKEGVLAAILRRALDERQHGLLPALLAHPEDAGGGVRAAVASDLRWIEGHRRDARLLLDHHRLVDAEDPRALPYDRAAFLKAVHRWVTEQASAGRMPRMPPERFLALTLAPAWEIAGRWVRDPGERPPTAHASALGDAAWAAVLAAGPDPG